MIAKKIALIALCVVLVVAAAAYLHRSPLFLCLYCVLLGLGIFWIARWGPAAITAAGVAVVVVQAVVLVVFTSAAIHHRMQPPQGSTPIGLHWYGSIFFQAAIVILLIFGFRPVVPRREGAKNFTTRLPWVILLALSIQGVIAYSYERFAANELQTILNSHGSSAPVGSLAGIVGTSLFGSYTAGIVFACVLAVLGVLTLVGAVLACLDVRARVGGGALSA